MTPDDLIQIEAIKRLKYRYARLLDTKDFDALDELFVPEATASYSGGQLSYEGRDAIVAFLRDALGSTEMITSHLVGQPEIELTGPDSAEGRWALQDLVIVRDRSVEIRGTAFYDDRYVKAGGSWKFEHTGYRRVYEEIGPRGPEVKITASWWDGGSSSIVAREPET